MPVIVTIEQYAGRYLAHCDFTQERRANAVGLLAIVNPVLALAIADGVPLEVNPTTGCLISGSGNGGFRPQDCPIGAPTSNHKQGRGIDIYDPRRLFARWCLRNIERLKALGVRGMENPQWTPTWVHLQDITVKSGKFVFIPDTSPAKAPPLPEQTGQAGFFDLMSLAGVVLPGWAKWAAIALAALALYTFGRFDGTRIEAAKRHELIAQVVAAVKPKRGRPPGSKNRPKLEAAAPARKGGRKAKAGGRNAIRFFDQDIAVHLSQRVALEADLNQALALQLRGVLHRAVGRHQQARPELAVAGLHQHLAVAERCDQPLLLVDPQPTG